MYLPPQLVLQFENLAGRYGYSRSELIRLAVERGYPAVKKWCGESDFVGVAGLGAAGGDLQASADASSVPSGSGSSAAAEGFASPVAALSRYAGGLIGKPEARDYPALRGLVAAHAADVGLSAQQAAPYVDVLARDVFHRSAELADAGTAAPAGARGGRRGRTSSAAPPAAPRSGAVSSSPSGGDGLVDLLQPEGQSAGADDPSVVVPDLD